MTRAGVLRRPRRSRQAQADTQTPLSGSEHLQPVGQSNPCAGEQAPPQVPVGLMHLPFKRSEQTQPSGQFNPRATAQPPPQVPGAGAWTQVPPWAPVQTQPGEQKVPSTGKQAPLQVTHWPF